MALGVKLIFFFLLFSWSQLLVVVSGLRITSKFMNPKVTDLPNNFKSCGLRCNMLAIPSNFVMPDKKSTFGELRKASEKYLKIRLDRDFRKISLPAFLGLIADPLVSVFDGIFVGKLGAAAQAGMGIATSAQYSVAKLYNDPLLKTTTSLVANKKGDELGTSISSAVAMASIIGLCQSLVYFFFADFILTFMNVAPGSEMRLPALSYLRWRALGVPASTMLIVCNGIFRGRGDTKTPLFYTTLGNMLNLVLSPLLIFGLGMGVGGAGAANAVAQWLIAFPVMWSLYSMSPFSMIELIRKREFALSVRPYLTAGALIVLRTIAKVAALAASSSAAARLGTVTMAAYSLSYTLMFVASQLCEALAVSSQALLARDMPLNSPSKRKAARHVIFRSLQVGTVASVALAATTFLSRHKLLELLTNSDDVRKLAAGVIPWVLAAQVLTGVASTMSGILMGGHDWVWASTGMAASSAVAVAIINFLPPSFQNLWLGMTSFLAFQLTFSVARILSRTGPWENLWN